MTGADLPVGWDESDLDVLVMALRDQNMDTHDMAVVLDRTTGRVHVWTSDTGLDGDESIDGDAVDEMDVTIVEALPPHVWFGHMESFVGGLAPGSARDDLARALRERKPFRRFRDVLHQRHPDLVAAWRGHEDACQRAEALSWVDDALGE